MAHISMHDYRTTSTFLRHIGPVLVPAWHIPGSARRVQYAPAVFDPQWVARLPLPIDAPPVKGQSVALAASSGSDNDRLERPTTRALDAAYRQRPRTHIFESIEATGEGWTALTTFHLSSIVQRRIICALYHSTAQDDTLGPHDDNWWGVIVQMRGNKQWRIWDKDGHEPMQLTLTSGDVLLLPAGVTHDVATPVTSTHLVFAVTDQPITTAQPEHSPMWRNQPA